MQQLKRSTQCGALKAAAIMLAAAATAEVWATDSKSQAENETTKTKSEIAVDAYDKADAKPVENWFGCPPVVEGNPSPAEQAAVKDHCEPATESQPSSAQ